MDRREAKPARTPSARPSGATRFAWEASATGGTSTTTGPGSVEGGAADAEALGITTSGDLLVNAFAWGGGAESNGTADERTGATRAIARGVSDTGAVTVNAEEYAAGVAGDSAASSVEVIDAVSGGTAGALTLRQRAIGGDTTSGGDAISRLTATNEGGGSLRIESRAFGGGGRSSTASVLSGGDALSEASGTGSDSEDVVVFALARGGSVLSDGMGQGGGAALGTVFGESNAGGDVFVSGEAEAGTSHDVHRGTNVEVVDAVSGETSGRLVLDQIARGGVLAGTTGSPDRKGGDATSQLAIVSQAADLSLRVEAAGGGQALDLGNIDAVSGDARAVADGTGPGAVSVEALASGADSLFESSIASGLVQAHARATGADVTADSTAAGVGNGVLRSMRANARAQGTAISPADTTTAETYARIDSLLGAGTSLASGTETDARVQISAPRGDVAALLALGATEAPPASSATDAHGGLSEASSSAPPPPSPSEGVEVAQAEIGLWQSSEEGESLVLGSEIELQLAGGVMLDAIELIFDVSAVSDDLGMLTFEVEEEGDVIVSESFATGAEVEAYFANFLRLDVPGIFDRRFYEFGIRMDLESAAQGEGIDLGLSVVAVGLVVPEPGTGVLVGMGLIAVALRSRSQRGR